MKRITALFLVLTTLLTLFGASISVNAAESFEFKGIEYKVRDGATGFSFNNNSFTLGAVKNAPTVVDAPTSVPEKYDISVDIALDTADQALFVAYFGSTRIYCSIKPDGFMFMSDPQTVTIGYKVGAGRRTYRFVGDGTSTRFFVDGFYVSVIKLPAVTHSQEISFGAYSNDNMFRTATIYDVQIKEKDPSFEASINAAAASGSEGGKAEEVDLYNWPGTPGIPKTEKPIYALAYSSFPREMKQIIVSQLPKEEVYFDFDGTEDYVNWTGIGTKPIIENGLYRLVTENSVIANSSFALPDVENFTIEARIRYDNTAPRHYLTTMNNSIFIHMLYDGVYVENGKEKIYSDKIEIGTDWHIWKFKFLNGGTNFEIYVDGTLILEGDTEPGGGTHPGRGDYYTIYDLGEAGETKGIFEIDWRRYTPDLNANAIALKTKVVMDSSEYIKGEDIAIRAETDDLDIPAIRYLIDGDVVAVGKKEDGYKTLISGLNAGSYSVYAECEGVTSKAVNFKVVPAIDGKLDVTKTSGNSARVSVELYDKNEDVKSVDFFVDGNLVATKKEKPFFADISFAEGTTHAVSAMAKAEGGAVLEKYSEAVYPDLSGSQTTTNYANEIRYSVSGNSGSATVNVSNGTYKLLMTHTKDGFTYLTDEGEGTFECGTGDFIVMTDAYAADVYYNGMLVESFAMPMTTEVAKTTANNGLSIEGFNVTVPEEKVTYFSRTDVRDENSYTELAYIPYSYVADLIMDRNENVRFYIKDGYFRNDVKIEDGKVYAIAKFRKMYYTEMGSYSEDAEPVWRLLGELPKTDGDMLIRLETVGGIGRIYANDQQIGVFRGIVIAGGAGVAFDVESGSAIKKFTISDASDVYYYEDDFDGASNFSTSDYWKAEGAELIVDENNGMITLDSSGVKGGWATIDVVASEAEVSADIEIEKGKGGFWYLFGKQDRVGGFVGYNFETKKFELGETVRDETTKILEVDGTLPVGEVVNWTINTKRDEATDLELVELFINGEKVISGYSTCHNNANLGFASSGNAAEIYNFKYRGNSKPVLGMLIYHSPGYLFTRGFMTDEGTYFVGEKKSDYLFTNDGGKTFTNVPYETAGVQLFNSFVHLENGDILGIDHGTYHVVKYNGVTTYQQHTYISKDKGKSWQPYSIIRPEKPYGTGMENRAFKTSTGRIINASSDEYDTGGSVNEDYGAETIFYSDDEGKTWQTSDIVRSREIGMVLGESIALERSDGTIRLYFRSGPGSINYIESHDNGTTFDFSFVGSTPFESNVNCFNITKDPTNPDTWWAAWGYDWSYDKSPNAQRPRERFALAVSYDEGDSWEYVGTVKEVNYDFARHGHVASYNMNVGVFVDDKAVYIRYMGSEEAYVGTNKSHFIDYNFAIDKSKIVSTKSWEKLHFRDNFYQIGGSLEFVMEQDKLERTMLVGTNTDNLFFGNNFYDNGAHEGNIQAEYAAAFAGADVKIKGNTVVFTRGSSEVVFEGDAVKLANGKTYISTAVFAEKYNYRLYEQEGYTIVTKAMGWIEDDKEVFLYTVGDYIEPNLYDPEAKKDAWRAYLKEIEEKEAAAAAEETTN